jgi:uncharacterized protein YacL
METTANVTGVLIAATPTSWMGIIWLYIIAVAFLAFLPRFVDMFLAYRHQRALMAILIESTKEQITKIAAEKRENDSSANQILDKIKGLIAEVAKPPEGMPGIARLTIAFSIIIIMGIALFHLIVFGNVSVNIVSNIITSLVAIIGTIAGFYFGGKAGEEAAKKKNGETK